MYIFVYINKMYATILPLLFYILSVELSFSVLKMKTKIEVLMFSVLPMDVLHSPR